MVEPTLEPMNKPRTTSRLLQARASRRLPLMAASLLDLEAQLALLTDAEKAQLMMKLLPAFAHAFAGVERRPGVCGGEACVVRTRVPAWTIERYRRLGWTEAQIGRASCRERVSLTV